MTSIQKKRKKKMESHSKLFDFSLILFWLFFFSIFLSGQQGVLVSANKSSRSFNPTKLFVFGDSYSDTGNSRKSQGHSWKVPYGITFPGKPSGRYSDGRVLTDFLARFIGVKSPLPYQWRKVVDPKYLKYGMNFASGGTGVFNTFVDPNMTIQIDHFERLINESIYTRTNLQSSIALVTVAGNDYVYNTLKTGRPDNATFVTMVVNQMYINLKRIHNLGVKKIAVTDLEPIGCMSPNTANTSFSECNTTINLVVTLHNVELEQAVAKLNNENSDSPFLVLHLYDSFMAIIKNKGNDSFGNPLKPCCVGTSIEYSCGSVDQNGKDQFRKCEKPQSAFFWDNSHPTEQGWRAICSYLQDTFHKLIY